LLKGAALSNLYYQGTGLRPMADVDIAVRRNDMGKAIVLLRGAGWHVRETELQDFKLDDTKVLDQLLQQHHGFQFKNAEGHEIDLHHHLLKDAFTAAADAWFWNTSVACSFLGMQMRRLDATALLLHVIVHGLRPNVEPPLRWVADAHAILAASGPEIRWDEMIAMARAQSLSQRLYLGLSYLAERFQAPVPMPALQQLQTESSSFTEWAERKYVLDPERPASVAGWVCSVLAGEARRLHEQSRLVFAAQIGARVQLYLGRRLKSALTRPAG
jgi:hypothetical protein